MRPTNCSRGLLGHDSTSGGRDVLFGLNRCIGPNSQTFNFIPRPPVDDVDELGLMNDRTFDLVPPFAVDAATRQMNVSFSFSTSTSRIAIC